MASVADRTNGFHARKLEGLRMIEQVETVNRRGAVEHYFRLVPSEEGR